MDGGWDSHKIDRAQLCEALEPGTVELIVTGELSDGRTFEGRDVVIVIGPGNQ